MKLLHDALIYQLLGMPVWAWVATLLLGTQEMLARSAKYKANTWVQAMGNACAWMRRSTPLGRFPLVAQILWLFALPGTPPPPTLTDSVSPAAPRNGGFIGLVVLMTVAALGFALAMLSCGCAPTAAYVAAVKVENAASGTIDAAYLAWRKTDRAHQEDLISASTSWADFEAKVTEWRVLVQAPVDKAFADARDAVGALDGSLKAVDAIKRKDFSAALATIAIAVAALAEVAARHGLSLPGLSIPPTPTTIRSSWRAEAGPVDCDPREPCPQMLWPDEVNLSPDVVL